MDMTAMTESPSKLPPPLHIGPLTVKMPRSVQVYGVDSATNGAAVKILVEEDRADHSDMNIGCPVPKVTRQGGDDEPLTYLDAGRMAKRLVGADVKRGLLT